MDAQPVKVEVELMPDNAMALAQLVKRISWTSLRECAVSDAEAERMADAVNKLQRALAEVGYAPR